MSSFMVDDHLDKVVKPSDQMIKGPKNMYDRRPFQIVWDDSQKLIYSLSWLLKI